MLREIESTVEPTLDIHVVLDNLSAHRAPPVQLTEKALNRGSHTSIPQLREAILADVDAHNERCPPFNWVKTADEILDSLRRFGLRVQQVHGQ